MKNKKSSLDLLRSGVRVSERFKLLERIPRWVADRRFLAQRDGRTQREQILFWELEHDLWERWLAGAEKFVAVDHSSLLRPRVLDEFQGLCFMVAREIRGVSLEEKMQKEGALLPDEIRQVFPAAVSLFQSMVEQGLSCPCLDRGAVLLEQTEANTLQPVFFPWATPGFSAVLPEAAPASLRDFLLCLSTNRSIPFAEAEAAWEQFPPSVRSLFPVALRQMATWETIAEAAAQMQEQAREDARPVTRKVPTAKAETTAEPPPAAGPPEVISSRERIRRSKEISGRPASGWKKPALWAAVFFVTGFAAGWFFHQWSISIPPEASGWKPAELREAVPLESARPAWLMAPGAAPASIPVVPSAAAPVAQTPARPSLPEGGNIPTEPSSPLEEDMLRWEQEWTNNPDEARIERGFTGFLEQLEFHRDALRAGRMPLALEALERVADQGFVPANYLLGQVLWGRESLRAETIMAELARDGHEGARAWCVERAIEWE